MMLDEITQQYKPACVKCGSWDINRVDRSGLEKLFARNKYYCRSCRKTSYRIGQTIIDLEAESSSIKPHDLPPILISQEESVKENQAFDWTDYNQSHQEEKERLAESSFDWTDYNQSHQEEKEKLAEPLPRIIVVDPDTPPFFKMELDVEDEDTPLQEEKQDDRSS